MRGTIDALQFTATEQLAGPGYAYRVDLNNSATSLLFDVGYRHPYGRLAPFVFVGAGASYVSSSQLDGQQGGQAQHLGAASGYSAAVHGGLGLEYRLFHSRLIPCLKLNVLALPGRQVAGERLLFVTPLLGLKFPI